MKEWFSQLGFYISYWIVRAVVSLRYRIKVVGMEELEKRKFDKPGGILFLPNHPAEIDPVLMEVALWRKFRPRPLIIEHFYRLKGFKFFLDLAKVLPIPTMDVGASKWRAKKVEKQFNTIVELLKKKQNFLIYPSGRLQFSNQEVIGGASFVHRLLEACPEANVVLVRTTGLWGSMFSRALTGISPDFGKTVWKGVKILFKNGLFFTPRRHVKIELESPPLDFPYGASRLEFNKYLENWYNRTAQGVKLVSYAFWKREFPTVFTPSTVSEAVEEKPVSAAIQKEVLRELAHVSGQDIETIKRSMSLSRDLGLDSLDIAQLYVYLDEQFEVSDLIPGDLRTVEDVLQAAAGYKKERDEQSVPRESLKRSWPEEKRDFEPQIPSGQTVQEVFLKSMDRGRELVACTDLLTGPLSYRKLKLAVLVLSLKIRTLPGEKIGVLLPSSVGAYLTFFAVLCAGKTPVMLNWTAGVRALDHALDITGFSTVISSDRFLDRLENDQLGKCEECLLLLEDIKKQIGWKKKIRGWWLHFKSSKRLLKKLKIDTIDKDAPAVILFTSGTEALPKAVPLSHENLLSNQRACLECVLLHSEDILYNVLPPFHSFGISLSGMMPLLAGFRVCFAPNPNDTHNMALDIAAWKPTLFFCAPSFIRALFRVARPQQLMSLRYLVSGAEKTPQELFDYVHRQLPATELLEGYGITECSPVVSCDRPGKPHKGIGLPLPGVEILIVDEHGIALPALQEGEICISGPNVFAGYLGSDKNPFLNLKGRRYYRSGDRGMLDRDGTLLLKGRMKRFVKIGGEMISLSGLEEELLKIAREKRWVLEDHEGPALAISVKEKDSEKPLIVLFTTFSVTKEDVNSILKESGYGRIVKIGDVRKVSHIPLTGTGKTHYRLLDEQA